MCASTLAGSREQHLRLQPNHPVGVHHSCGSGVRQTHQILPLLFLDYIQNIMGKVKHHKSFNLGNLSLIWRTDSSPCGHPRGWRICAPQAGAPSWLLSSPHPSWLSDWPTRDSCKQTQNCRKEMLSCLYPTNLLIKINRETMSFYPFHAHRSTTINPWSSYVLMWWNRPIAAPLNLRSTYSPGSFLAMWKLVFKNKLRQTYNFVRKADKTIQQMLKFTPTVLLLGSRWTQSSPCSWNLECSRRSETWADWFSPGFPQRQSSFPTCQN